MMPLWNILVGEYAFGGIGCGMYCMLFSRHHHRLHRRLMIGRTPEYLGKNWMLGSLLGR